MKYKIGDKVKIREDLKGGCCYGLYCDAEMEKYKGKIATITEVTDNGFYRIDLDKEEWYWSDDMFENYTLTEKQFNDKISELEKQIAELKEQLEKKDNKTPVGEIWIPKYDKTYYNVNCYDNTADEQINDFTDFDRQLIGIGNCYPTKEKAEFEAQREKYTRLFRQYVEQHSEPLDWENNEQSKWFVCWSHNDKKMCFWSNTRYQFLGSIYASSEKILKEAIHFVGEDNVKKYILECE